MTPKSVCYFGYEVCRDSASMNTTVIILCCFVVVLFFAVFLSFLFLVLSRSHLSLRRPRHVGTCFEFK